MADEAVYGAVGDSFEDLLDAAEGAGFSGGWGELGDGGQGAVDGVDDEFVDDGFGHVVGAGGVVGIVHHLLLFVPLVCAS
jgi:hypothetical protein